MIDPLSTGQIVALAIALVCLAISGFVSGSEIAFFSLTRKELNEADEADGPESTLGIRNLLRQSERLLATILIANNMVNIAIVILTNYGLGPVFKNMPEVLSFVLQTVLLTFLILLFGEILPKLAAQRSSLRWARATAGIWRMLTDLLRPFSGLVVSS